MKKMIVLNLLFIGFLVISSISVNLVTLMILNGTDDILGIISLTSMLILIVLLCIIFHLYKNINHVQFRKFFHLELIIVLGIITLFNMISNLHKILDYDRFKLINQYQSMNVYMVHPLWFYYLLIAFHLFLLMILIKSIYKRLKG